MVLVLIMAASTSCALPPALGLLPYPTKEICLQAGSGLSRGRAVSQVWWAAESNRSSADFVAVCPGGAARAYSPIACLLVETDVQAPGSGRGRRGVLELDLELTPGVWGLRYYRKTAATKDEEGGGAARAGQMRGVHSNWHWSLNSTCGSQAAPHVGISLNKCSFESRA